MEQSCIHIIMNTKGTTHIIQIEMYLCIYIHMYMYVYVYIFFFVAQIDVAMGLSTSQAARGLLDKWRLQRLSITGSQCWVPSSKLRQTPADRFGRLVPTGSMSMLIYQSVSRCKQVYIYIWTILIIVFLCNDIMLMYILEQ